MQTSDTEHNLKKAKYFLSYKTVPVISTEISLLYFITFLSLSHNDEDLMFYQTVPWMLALARREPVIYHPLSSFVFKTSH